MPPERACVSSSLTGTMDAAAADADVKLYKASAELLSELQEKLPLLLDLDRVPRKWTLYHKGSELAQLVSQPNWNGKFAC